MREEVKSLIAQSLGIEISDVEESKLLREDLGFDETELSQIYALIEDKYGVELIPTDRDEIKTVEELLDTLESLNPKAN